MIQPLALQPPPETVPSFQTVIEMKPQVAKRKVVTPDEVSIENELRTQHQSGGHSDASLTLFHLLHKNAAEREILRPTTKIILRVSEYVIPKDLRDIKKKL